MNKPDIEAIDEELNVTSYARGKSKGLAVDIRDNLAKIDIVSGMVASGILEPDVYKDWVERVRVEIKDSLAYIFEYLHLEDTKGHCDQVFVQSTTQGGGKGE